MQFTVPFIKVAGTPSGNLPEISQQRPSPSTKPEVSIIDDLHQETLLSEDMFSEPRNPTTDQQSRPPPSFLSLPPSPRPPAPTPPQPGAPSASQRDSLSPSEHGQPIRKKKSKTMPSDADKAFIEYFSAKTAKLTNTYSEHEKREGVQNFLNSLIPDLMKMNDVQLRTYKRKTLLLIDEVMGTSPEVLYRPSTSVVQSYQGTTTAGFTTDPNQIPQSSHIAPSPPGSGYVHPSDPSEYSLSPEEIPIVLQHL